MLNFCTKVSSLGTGHVPSSPRCGTHFLSVTAHLVKSPTTSFENSSPHLIWHSASSGLVRVRVRVRVRLRDRPALDLAFGLTRACSEQAAFVFAFHSCPLS